MSTRIENRLRTLARLAAMAAGGIALVTLTGWWLDLPRLRSFVTGAISMRPNAAVAALLLAVSLLLLAGENIHAWRRRLARTGPLLVAAISATTLLEYTLDWDAGIDWVLFPRAVREFGAYGGRVAAIAAFDYLLLAAALWLGTGRKAWSWHVRQVVTVLAAVFPLLSLLGYTFHVQSLYTLGPWAAQSLPSALACLLLSVGALLAWPERGWVSVLASEHPGGALLRLALPLVLGLTWLVSWLSVAGVRAGLYSEDVDQAFVAAPLMLLFCLFLFLMARALNRAGEREQAQRQEVERLNQGLEARVAQRTAQLGETISALEREMGERKQAEAQLRRSSLYARSLLEASLDPLVTISKDGKIMDANRAAEEATGVVRDKLIGSDFSNYFTEPEKARRGYELVFAQGFVQDYPLAIRHVSGRVTDVLYNATVFRNEAREVEGVFAAARDITERKQAEQQVRRASLYTRSLIEASLDPLVTISKEGKIMDVNRATELATGTTRERLIGSDFCEYFTEPERAREGYEQVFSRGFVQDYPLAIRRTSGRRTEVLYNATVFQNEAGEVEGVFAAARDITERVRAEQEVRALNAQLEERVRQRTAELEESNRELESFTYSVSHDLRAPLRHVDGFSKILLEEYGPALDEAGRRYLERVRQGTQFMGRLVDDLLNLSRVGRQTLSVQITGLGTLVEEVRKDLAAEAEGREVEWKIGELPFVECDPGLMKQVVANLLSNALKFTRPRARAVIEVGQQPGDGGPVLFVRDNGVGFHMKYADKLFGIFQRLHRQEDFEGTGVGLATVERILHKHGGRVWAEAELDKGATFYFTLGAAEVSAERPAEGAEVAA